jgi:hypothetical protein
MLTCANSINNEWKEAAATGTSEGHRRDAAPQSAEDWLMRLCKGLKTLSFTVN